MGDMNTKRDKLLELIGEASMLNEGGRTFDAERAIDIANRIEQTLCGWGPGGRESVAGADAFDRGYLGTSDSMRPYELIFGEHPHSRSDNNVYARFPDGRVEAFNGHRVQVAFEMRTTNYLKTSGLSGDEIRRSCRGIISMGVCEPPVPVYEVGARDPLDCLMEAQRALSALRMLEVSGPQVCSERGRKELIGRKVYWQNQPGVVTRFIGDQGAVIIEPEMGAQFRFDEDDHETYVKEDILASSIRWHREEKSDG